MRLYFIFFLICISFRVVAQDPKAILQKVNKIYFKEKSFQVDMKFLLYKGHYGEFSESYLGTLFQEKNKYYQKIDKTEFILTPDFCLKVNHLEKNVLLLTGENVQLNFQSEILKTFDKCQEVTLKTLDKYYLLTLIFKSTLLIPYEKITIKILKSSYHIAQLDLFYAEERDFSKRRDIEDNNKPHMRVLYSNFTDKSAIKPSVFLFNTYFKTANDMIFLKGSLVNYKLIDKRI